MDVELKPSAPQFRFLHVLQCAYINEDETVSFSFRCTHPITHFLVTIVIIITHSLLVRLMGSAVLLQQLSPAGAGGGVRRLGRPVQRCVGAQRAREARQLANHAGAADQCGGKPEWPRQQKTCVARVEVKCE